MSSQEVIDRLLREAPHRGSTVREFLSALAQGRTYSPFRNTYVLFGFLWGLPIPFFSILLDHWASGLPIGLSLLTDHPIHFFFLAHPLLFACVFGAMGTIRYRKDRQIMRLVVEIERRAVDLASANDKLKELDLLKAQFMANVTHELKTPLVAVRGYTESILEGRFGTLNDRQRQGLEVSIRNVDRLQKLIDELLEFERIESGSMKLTLEDFDLIPVIRGAVDGFQPLIEEKRIRVQNRLPDFLMVHADRDKIGRVFRNLVSNALKFSPDDSAIGVRLRIGEDDGHALITVWDQGPGIATAAQKYLFTRFWQADGSVRRRYGGTGLGLAIVKGILDAHGSPIRISSAEKTGTTAEFPLPLAEPVTTAQKRNR